MADFTSIMLAVAALAAFRRDRAIADARFPVAAGDGDGTRAEVAWLGPDGAPLADWSAPGAFALMLRRTARPDLLIVLNPGDDTTFALPDQPWRRVLDTAEDPVSCDRPAPGPQVIGWQCVVVFEGG